MVVSVEKVLDAMEGRIEAAGINQLDRTVARPGVEEAEGNESHA